MTKDDYLQDTSDAQDGSVCTLKIVQNTENFNIFGTPLMIGYYVMFEADNNRIGFTPNKVSSKPYLVESDEPIRLLAIDDGARNWPILILLLIGAAGFLSIWFFCVWGKLLTGTIAKIVATLVYILILFLGEFYLYRWMVRKNVFGAEYGSQDTTVVVTVTMMAYGLVTTALYNAVMKSLSR